MIICPKCGKGLECRTCGTDLHVVQKCRQTGAIWVRVQDDKSVAVADVPVTLKVYNVLGAEVATLVDTQHEAGVYTVRWDAGDLASGMYFCRLQAGEFTAVKKMVLLR